MHLPDRLDDLALGLALYGGGLRTLAIIISRAVRLDDWAKPFRVGPEAYEPEQGNCDCKPRRDLGPQWHGQVLRIGGRR